MPMSYAGIQSVATKHANEMCAHAYELHSEAGVRRCLLGWMAADVGLRLPEERYNNHALGMAGTGRFVKVLRSAYGLSLYQLKLLQRANDESKNPTDLTVLLSGLFEAWSFGPVPSGTEGNRRQIDDSPRDTTATAVYGAPSG